MTLANYLAQFGCEDIVTGRLTIGRHTFVAARYTQHGACSIYIIGERPPMVKRKRNKAFRINGAVDDWYVSCYMDGPISDAFKDCHPFGPSFMLGLWDFSEPIDKHNFWHGEHKPYLRVPVKWTEA